jgi:predicted  nucleic acid-binding Zn-ribbon protein
MAEEIKQAKENTGDPTSFVCPLDHGMSDEEAAELKRAQEEAEDARNEVMFAKQEIEDLKRELWEVKRVKKELEEEVERGSGENVSALEGQIEELRGVNEDLDLEVKGLREEVEQKNDELVCQLPPFHGDVNWGF